MRIRKCTVLTLPLLGCLGIIGLIGDTNAEMLCPGPNKYVDNAPMSASPGQSVDCVTSDGLTTMARGHIANASPGNSRAIFAYLFNSGSQLSAKSWGNNNLKGDHPIPGCTTVDKTKNGVWASDIYPTGTCPTYEAFVTAYSTVVAKGPEGFSDDPNQ